MTEDEWVTAYAARSGVDPVRLLERRAARGQRPGPCDCGDPICEGWAWTDDEVMLENLSPEADLVPHPFEPAVGRPDLCHTCGQTEANPLHDPNA